MTINCYIRAIGHSCGEHLITNDFLESLDIGTSSKWIQKRTGINSRYSVLSPQTIFALRHKQISLVDLWQKKIVPCAASMCKTPWQRALKQTAQEFVPDTVICGTSISDWDIPAQASIIADSLNLKANAFDVNSACSSFVVNLCVARALIISEQSRNVVIFNPERYSVIVDYNDRASCVLFGDGATCTLVSADAPSSGNYLQLMDTSIYSNPKGAQQVRISRYNTFFQNGSAVQKFAISKSYESSMIMLNKHNMGVEDIDYFVGHQANLRMLQQVVKRMNIQAVSSHLYNVDTYGNQGAAGAPSVLAEHWDKITTANKPTLISVVGSGLTWGSALLLPKQ